MTLTFYIARRFLTSVGQVFAVFFGILMLIDMIEQLRRFSGSGVGLSRCGADLSLFNVPETLYRILPLILIMGAIALFPVAGAVVRTGGGAGGGAVGPAVPADPGAGGAGDRAVHRGGAEPVGRGHAEGL